MLDANNQLLPTLPRLRQLQGLWQIRNFSVGSMSLEPELLCTIGGVSPQVGDISVLSRGDIVVSVGQVVGWPAGCKDWGLSQRGHRLSSTRLHAASINNQPSQQVTTVAWWVDVLLPCRSWILQDPSCTFRLRPCQQPRRSVTTTRQSAQPNTLPSSQGLRPRSRVCPRATEVM